MRTDEEIKAAGVWGIHPIPGVGMCGFVKLPQVKTCTVIWTPSNRHNLVEHVSINPKHKYYIPTWEDMCALKDIFWNDEDEVYQIHPSKSQYVNMLEGCLHLWKPEGDGILEDLAKYSKVGGVEVCRKAVEKQIPKKLELYGNCEDGKLLCPSCKEDVMDLVDCGFNNCPYCGQAFDWSVED